MKKSIRLLLLIAAITALLCITAFADDTITQTDASGIYNVTASTNVTYQAFTATGTTAITSTAKTFTDGTTTVTCTNFYADAVKLKVTYAVAATGNFYLVRAQNASGTPTEGNLVYIDQVTATAASVEFTVYPKDLVAGSSYYVYMTTNGTDANLSADKPIIQFKYYAPYKLGDVNDDKVINIDDAMAIINHIVQKPGEILTGNNLLAADVTNSNGVNIDDAMEIINYIVGRPQYLK